MLINYDRNFWFLIFSFTKVTAEHLHGKHVKHPQLCQSISVTSLSKLNSKV